VDRLIGLVAGLLVAAFVLPIVAGFAVQAVPALVWLLVLLGVLRLFLS
jgi:hypothetical protein